MSEYVNFFFEESISAAIADKLNGTGLFPEVSPIRFMKVFRKDGFHADGTPKQREGNMLYPIYAAAYLGYPIPSAYLDVQELYRKNASKAALQWLEKLLPYQDVHCDLSRFDGEVVSLADLPSNHKDIFACFPVTYISYCDQYNGVTGQYQYPVIVWPDSRENDGDWEDGVLPYYAEIQARMTLWCWRQSRRLLHCNFNLSETAYIVRITGNTPGDLMVRCIQGDEAAETRLMERIVKAYCKAVADGRDPLSNLQRKTSLNWLEERQLNDEDAYRIEDADFYEILRQYMEVRSHRKTLEAELEEIENEMDAISLEVAHAIEPSKTTGEVNGDSEYQYKVSHSKRSVRPASVSASLLRQFFPQYTSAIRSTVSEKGRVTVECI